MRKRETTSVIDGTQRETFPRPSGGPVFVTEERFPAQVDHQVSATDETVHERR